MTEQQLLEKQVKYVAKELKCTFVEACQKMQSTASKLGKEEMIEKLHKVKMNHLNMEA